MNESIIRSSLLVLVAASLVLGGVVDTNTDTENRYKPFPFQNEQPSTMTQEEPNVVPVAGMQTLTSGEDGIFEDMFEAAYDELPDSSFEYDSEDYASIDEFFNDEEFQKPASNKPVPPPQPPAPPMPAPPKPAPPQPAPPQPAAPQNFSPSNVEQKEKEKRPYSRPRPYPPQGSAQPPAAPARNEQNLEELLVNIQSQLQTLESNANKKPNKQSPPNIRPAAFYPAPSPALIAPAIHMNQIPGGHVQMPVGQANVMSAVEQNVQIMIQKLMHSKDVLQGLTSKFKTATSLNSKVDALNAAVNALDAQLEALESARSG